ncbi:MAG: lipocalin family protein [Flavobacteriaceae bacterium]
MKNLFYLLMVALIVSCSASKSGSSTATKMNKKTLKGTWEVSDIRFVGEEGLYKANLFGLADSPCFKGSDWVFIPNNGTGKFTIESASRCEAGTHRILWSFNETGYGSTQFQFKYVDEKNKPLSGDKSGYRAKIDTLTDSNMVLRVKSNYQGTAFDVVLTMNKVSEDYTL